MNLPNGSRKFIVVMTALACSTIVALACDAAVLGSYALVVSACVGAYMGAHAVADSKWSRPDAPKPTE